MILRPIIYMSNLKDDLETALGYAKKEAEKVDGGDPGTMVSTKVDGRSGFVSKMKDNGDKKGGDYVFNTENGKVKLDGDDYSLHIDILKGTDIQKHKKKIRAYRAFNEKMEELGYSLGMDIDTYSY